MSFVQGFFPFFYRFRFYRFSFVHPSPCDSPSPITAPKTSITTRIQCFYNIYIFDWCVCVCVWVWVRQVPLRSSAKQLRNGWSAIISTAKRTRFPLRVFFLQYFYYRLPRRTRLLRIWFGSANLLMLDNSETKRANGTNRKIPIRRRCITAEGRRHGSFSLHIYSECDAKKKRLFRFTQEE